MAAGSRSAEIYSAHEGEIEKIDSIKMEVPTYSDKEGFFTRSGKGMTFGSGSVLEENKQELILKFVKELGEKVERSFQENSAENVYLFTPDHIKETILDNLSSEIRKEVVLTIEGNFVEEHPFDLLKMILKEIEDKKPVIATEEARKLLKKKK